MTDPGFRVDSVRQAAPYRARQAFGGYQAFNGGNRAVLVEPSTAEGLREAAAKAYPMETGGLLSGRSLRDNDGHYVLVSGFVQAGPKAGRSAAFEISPQATALLREEAHRAHPTADVVGWWHSHLVPSSYSQTDLNTQAIFTQPDSVGLLVFATSEPWAAAYAGPESSRLGFPSAVRGPDGPGRFGNGQAPAESPADQRAAPSPDQPVLSAPGSPTRVMGAWTSPSRSQGLVRLAVITGGVLILILILAIVVTAISVGLPSQIRSSKQQVYSGEQQLANEVNSAQQQLSGEIKNAAAPATPAFVSSACVPAMTPTGQYQGVLNCEAMPSVSGTVVWYLDGTPVHTGNTASIKVSLHDGARHTVQAVLETASGKYSGLAQQIPS